MTILQQTDGLTVRDALSAPAAGSHVSEEQTPLRQQQLRDWLHLHMVFASLQAPELSEEQKAQLQQQISGFEAQLATAPDNVEALEGAGVTYAQMGALKKAEGLLSRLVEKKTQDPEAWRLLVSVGKHPSN